MSEPRQIAAMRILTAGLVAAAVYLCWPLWAPLVLAAWTAMLATPLLVRFEARLAGRRRAAATLALTLLLAVALPLLLVVVGVVSGVQDLMVAVRSSPSATAALQAIAAGTGDPDAAGIPRTISDFIAMIQSHGAQGVNVVKRVVGAAGSGVVVTFIYFLGAYTFLVEGPAITRWAREHSPLRPEHLDRLAAAFAETGRGLIIGIGLTALTQGAVATVAYAALGIPRWWVLGALTGIASLLPLAGSALVWVPVAIGLFLTGHVLKAALLAAIGVGIIGTVDNFLRPVFSRMGSLQLPMFLLFVSVFGGMAAFGAAGIVLGPLIVRLSLEALAIRRVMTTSAAPTPGV